MFFDRLVFPGSLPGGSVWPQQLSRSERPGGSCPVCPSQPVHSDGLSEPGGPCLHTVSGTACSLTLYYLTGCHHCPCLTSLCPVSSLRFCRPPPSWPNTPQLCVTPVAWPRLELPTLLPKDSLCSLPRKLPIRQLTWSSPLRFVLLGQEFPNFPKQQ